jgi:hypothetical protein
MKAYAGIGSRTISEQESVEIHDIANRLSKSYVVYSGNACGADISFQIGSGGTCVINLPWDGFNDNKYDIKDSLCSYVVEDEESIESVKEFHPNYSALGYAGKKLMARNYRQIMGFKPLYPKVDFVICCADEDKKGNVKGGTGQAVRIAQKFKIPVINIRREGWKKHLIGVLKYDC